MTDTPVALIVFLALGAVAVVLALLLVRSRQELGRSQLHTEATETELEGASRYAADLGARLQAVESEMRHLVDARIPELAASLAHSNVPVPGPLGAATLSPELDRSIDAVLAQVQEEVVKERQRVDAAAQATLRGATTTIQALLYQLQTLLQRMQEKYEDPLVAEDLLAADFLNEQALRRIQSTAVVCGAWPGLTRENSHLADVVVGASSRLSGYERVQVSNLLRDPVGVVARAVEPVAVTLTELMANALHYSHPELPVVVTLQQGNRGASVIIDDAGVGMTTEELARAKRLMSGDEGVLITELGDPPRNGFAAIGQLVRQYGFSTHAEVSPYGGVRTVVHIPGEPLLTLLDEAEHPMSAMSPTPPYGTPVLTGHPGLGADMEARGPSPSPVMGPATPATAPGTGTGAGAGTGTGTAGAHELPRRRRRRRAEADEKGQAKGAEGGPGAEVPGVSGQFPGWPEAGASAPGTSGAAAVAPPSTPEESAERWAAFQQGTASGREAAGTGPSTTDGTGSGTGRTTGGDTGSSTASGPGSDTGRDTDSDTDSTSNASETDGTGGRNEASETSDASDGAGPGA